MVGQGTYSYANGAATSTSFLAPYPAVLWPVTTPHAPHGMLSLVPVVIGTLIGGLQSNAVSKSGELGARGMYMCMVGTCACVLIAACDLYTIRLHVQSLPRLQLQRARRARVSERRQVRWCGNDFDIVSTFRTVDGKS